MTGRGPPLLAIPRATVRQLMSLDDHLKAVEAAFRLLGEGRAVLPPPMHIAGLGGDFHVKAALLPLPRPYVAIKANGNFPGNDARFGLPTIQGAIILLDGERGSPLAFIDSIEITSARTGAASALAARHLADPDSATITICGCGEQGRIQLESIANVLPLRRGFVWDRDSRRADTFAQSMSGELGLELSPVDELADATRQSDVIVTCTTSTQPFLAPGMIRPGAFIAAVGADNPAKQEIEPALLAGSRVYADVAAQALAMGDTRHAIAAGLMKPGDLAGELADLVSGSSPGRGGSDVIHVFDSTGAAVQDVAAAAMVYERALANGAGIEVQLA